MNTQTNYPTLSQEEFGALKTGLQSYEHGRPWALGALPNMGLPMAVGQLYSGAKTEGLAGKTLGAKDTGILDSLTSATIGSDKSYTQQLINRIKQDEGIDDETKLTSDIIQNWGIKNYPHLDLAPVVLEAYKDSGTFRDVEPIQTTYRMTQPFRRGSFLESIGFTGDYGKEAQAFEDGDRYGLGKTYAQAILSGEYDDQLKSLDQFAGDKISQSNIGTIDRETGQFKPSSTYDPAFARAVSIQNMKESGSYISPNDEPSPSFSFSDIGESLGSIFS